MIRIVQLNPLQICNYSTISLKYIVKKNILIRNEKLLVNLLYFSPSSFPILLRLLSRCTPNSSKDIPYFTNTYIGHYTIRSLSYFSPDTISFYLPQLVQCLRFDKLGLIKDYLYKVSKQSILASHQLIWNLKAESKNDDDSSNNKSMQPTHGYLDKLIGPDPLPAYATVMIGDIESILSPEAKVLYDDEFNYFELLSTVSAKLIKDEPQKRFKLIRDYLNEVKSQLSLQDKIIYLPTNPYKRLIEVIFESATPMQSAAKAPYFISFIVEDFGGPDACLKTSKDLINKKVAATAESESQSSMMKYVALTKNLKQKIAFKSLSSSSSSSKSPMKRMSLSDTIFSETEVDKDDNKIISKIGSSSGGSNSGNTGSGNSEDDFFTDTVLNQINKDKKNRTKQMKTFFQKYIIIYINLIFIYIEI